MPADSLARRIPHPFPTSLSSARDKQIHRHLFSQNPSKRTHMSDIIDSPISLAPHPAFQVTTGNKTWFVKAVDEDKEENLTNWVAAIRGTIARLKQETSLPQASQLPEFIHHSVGGRDFVVDSRYTDLKYVIFVFFRGEGRVAAWDANFVLFIVLLCRGKYLQLWPQRNEADISKSLIFPSLPPSFSSFLSSFPTLQASRQWSLRYGRLRLRHTNWPKNRH